MALWLARASKHGDHERRFLDEGRIYFTWDGLQRDLAPVADLESMYAIFGEVYPDAGDGQVRNWGRQAMQFTHRMDAGDWIALPSKINPAIHFGKVIGPYQYIPDAPDPYFHARAVEWFAQDIPRDRFDQDLLYSLGAFLTIARIQRNNAEARVKEMAENGWHIPRNSQARVTSTSSAHTDPTAAAEAETEAEAEIDLAEQASDQIAKLVLAKFQGHGLARLVKAILQAEGYEVHQPPDGPDKGVDLLAAPDNLGFGEPRICVQVKSNDTPIERTVLDQLIGVMQNFNAQRGLLVSWGGFKQSIERERAAQFFRVRLWDRDALLAALYRTYDKLPMKSMKKYILLMICKNSCPVIGLFLLFCSFTLAQDIESGDSIDSSLETNEMGPGWRWRNQDSPAVYDATYNALFERLLSIVRSIDIRLPADEIASNYAEYLYLSDIQWNRIDQTIRNDGVPDLQGVLVGNNDIILEIESLLEDRSLILDWSETIELRLRIDGSLVDVDAREGLLERNRFQIEWLLTRLEVVSLD